MILRPVLNGIKTSGSFDSTSAKGSPSQVSNAYSVGTEEETQGPVRPRFDDVQVAVSVPFKMKVCRIWNNKVALILSALFVIPLAATIILQSSLSTRLRKFELSPEEIFGSPLPSTIEIVLSQRIDNGAYARASLRDRNARLDVMIVRQNAPIPNGEILSLLKRIKAFKEETSLAPSLITLFLSQLNPLRTNLKKDSTIQIGSSEVKVSEVRSKDEESYFIGAFNLKDLQVGFLLLDMDNRLTPANLESALSVLSNIK